MKNFTTDPQAWDEKFAEFKFLKSLALEDFDSRQPEEQIEIITLLSKMLRDLEKKLWEKK